MLLQIPLKEATKAYVSNHLWLPRQEVVPGGVRVGPLRNALTFHVGNHLNSEGQSEAREIVMYTESRNHIIVPREFLPPTEYPKYKFQFVDLRPSFGSIHVEDLVQVRNQEQQNATNALLSNDNGILVLGCGKGKTKLAQKKIAQKKTPTLVIVPDGGILDQWRKSILGDERTPPGLRFEGQLGLIQGQTFDWRKPIVLALVTTLAPRIRDGRLPEEFFRYFGLIIYDEVHQIGAPLFSETAWPFYGDRIGLTATVKREDGLDPIYRYHIGEPFFTDLKQDLIPYVYFQKTPSQLDWEPAKRGSATNMSVLKTMMAEDHDGNVYRYWTIKEALDQGRKILALGESKKQLHLLHSMFPGSGLIVAETPREERLSILRNSQLCFAIGRLGATGVDDDRLDTLFWLTPTKSLIRVQQSIGRVQRHLEGKKHPVVIIFEDHLVNPLRNMCLKIKQIFKEWKFNFEVINPGRFPRDFTPEMRQFYDRRIAELRGIREEGEEGGTGDDAEG